MEELRERYYERFSSYSEYINYMRRFDALFKRLHQLISSHTLWCVGVGTMRAMTPLICTVFF